MASLKIEATAVFITDPSELANAIWALGAGIEATDVVDLVRAHTMILKDTQFIPYSELAAVPYPEELIRHTTDKMKKDMANEVLNKTGMIHLEQEGEWPPQTGA